MALNAQRGFQLWATRGDAHRTEELKSPKGNLSEKVISYEDEQPSKHPLHLQNFTPGGWRSEEGSALLFLQQDGCSYHSEGPRRMCGCPSTSLLTLKRVLLFHREVYRWFDGGNPTLVCPTHYRMLSIPTSQALHDKSPFRRFQTPTRNSVCVCVCICVIGM